VHCKHMTETGGRNPPDQSEWAFSLESVRYSRAWFVRWFPPPGAAPISPSTAHVGLVPRENDSSAPAAPGCSHSVQPAGPFVSSIISVLSPWAQRCFRQLPTGCDDSDPAASVACRRHARRTPAYGLTPSQQHACCALYARTSPPPGKANPAAPFPIVAIPCGMLYHLLVSPRTSDWISVPLAPSNVERSTSSSERIDEINVVHPDSIQTCRGSRPTNLMSRGRRVDRNVVQPAAAESPQ